MAKLTHEERQSLMSAFSSRFSPILAFTFLVELSVCMGLDIFLRQVASTDKLKSAEVDLLHAVFTMFGAFVFINIIVGVVIFVLKKDQKTESVKEKANFLLMLGVGILVFFGVFIYWRVIVG